MYKFKKDKYKNNRGARSRVLDVTCKTCDKHLFYYQKDGPGILKRCYLDRFIDEKPQTKKEYKCKHCRELLGIYQPYEKETARPAFRWLVAAINYTVVPISKLE
jgi:hypothetical protein